ncbi:MAG: hypothetical protein Q9167_000459 [Letrouitia subvulpina]
MSLEPSFKCATPNIRKILSLDGGGVRGVSIIIILTYIMRLLKSRRGFETQPWQEFDMMGGTSTGGLIAFMLGRMRMTLDECTVAYIRLTKDVFSSLKRHPADPRRLADILNAKEKFDERALEQGIYQALSSKSWAEDALLKDLRHHSCCVFVCATRPNLSLARFRSYDTDLLNPYYDDCQIWEAARATSAASTSFKPIEIGKYRAKFVDGTFIANNPVNEALSEAKKKWGENKSYMILSIGTGEDYEGSLLGHLLNLAECLAKLTTQTELTNQQFQDSQTAMLDSGRFYRFNVPGLGNVKLEEYEALDVIAEKTDTYLDKTYRQVSFCVDKIIEGGPRLVPINAKGVQHAGDFRTAVALG